MEQPHLQTRTEHSRSLEDAGKLRAIHTLTDIGLLIPLTDVETYHGRVGTPSDSGEWTVDPTFTNGSNDSGNYNVNARPTLYTSEKPTAEDFARQRVTNVTRPIYMQQFQDKVRNYSDDERQEWLDRQHSKGAPWFEAMQPDVQKKYIGTEHMVYEEAKAIEGSLPKDVRDSMWQESQQGYSAQVHKIVASDSDARVLDFSFDPSSLNDADKQAYDTALKAVPLAITEGSPVGFDAKDEIMDFIEVAKNKTVPVLSEEDVSGLSSETGIRPETALQLASALNARQFALVQPAYLAHLLIKNRVGIVSESFEINGVRSNIPINLEYTERFFREAHIVGVKQEIISDTLNRNIESISLFDLEAVNTPAHFEARRAETWKKLGSLASELAQSPAEEGNPMKLLRALEDVHVKPERLVEFARLIDGYDEIYAADAGNWEGFTLGEHTETVLRNFDENFADTLPVELLAPMRLMILAHDLGKPKAVANHAKHREKEYNLAQASDFFSKLELPANVADFLSSIMGDGVELAYQSEIRGDKSAMDKLRELAVPALTALNGDKQVTNDQIDGYVDMCTILLTCDGGAYTSMATTRRPGKGRYRNAPSFNHSFAKPVGPGKRGLRLANRIDVTAPPDLTPRAADTPKSRVKVSHRGAGRKPPKLNNT